MNLKDNTITPKEELESYLKETKLSYSNLAHSYLCISRIIHDKLKAHSTDLDKLKEGFDEVLGLILRTQKKDTIKDKDRDDRIEGKDTVWNNRNYVRDMMGLYLTLIQNLEQNKQISEQNKQFAKQNKYVRYSLYISVLFGVIVIIISLIDLFRHFFFS